MHDHLGDRLSNAISHGTGLILSIIGLVLLFFKANTQTEWLALTVYGFSLLFLYGSSTLHHAVKMKDAKGFFLLQSFDQAAIYVLIAGSYTPFILLGLDRLSGYGLLIGLWIVAVLGTVLKFLHPRRYIVIHVIAYILMGWSLALVWQGFKETLSEDVIRLIIIGGAFYMGGIPFYILSQQKPNWHYVHLVWHVFVLLGSIMHFFAVYQL
ncbi:MAG: hemolysin III family protein [Acholeplasmataceae bacterium]|nr:hemolysin III family protein [Acholeplasmataceae bacterium]